jgi:DNA-binding GntR family transcriptional regulator
MATRRVLADVVTDDLRDAIVTHELEPGRRLAEDELASQLGVSRGPVREALMRLEREGLVIIERHKGARVASWDRSDLEEIYSLRIVLEELAAEWACKNATAADFAAMETVLKEFERLTDKQRTPREVSKLDLAFHSAIFRSAHHDRLYRAWEILGSQIHAFLIYTWSRDESIDETFMKQWGPDHRKIMEVIKSGDIEAARHEAADHVTRGYERVSRHFGRAVVSKKR